MVRKALDWARARIRALVEDEFGASLVEYALMIALMVLVIVVALQNFANSFVEATNYISDRVTSAIGGT